MESYWERAARGAAPQNGGWQSLINPLANSGQPIDMNALVGPQSSGQGGPAWEENSRKTLATLSDRKEKSLQDKLFKEARDNQLAAKAATQSRLEEAITGYKERRTSAAAAYAGANKTSTDEINRHFDSLIGKTRLQYNASGLGQTSAVPTTIAGIERDRAAALASAGNQNAQTAVGADLSTSGDYLNFLTGIEDQTDDSALMELANRSGQATQQQLDPSAFGGNFFAGYNQPGIGGSGYGFGGGYADQGAGQQPMQQPQPGQGSWFGPQQQPNQLTPDQLRLLSYQKTRQQKAIASQRRRPLPLVPGNQYDLAPMNSNYGFA